MSAKPLRLGALSTKDVNVSESIASRSVVHPESKKITLPSPRLGARSKERKLPVLMERERIEEKLSEGKSTKTEGRWDVVG